MPNRDQKKSQDGSSGRELRGELLLHSPGVQGTVLYYPTDKNKKKAYFTGELRADG